MVFQREGKKFELEFSVQCSSWTEDCMQFSFSKYMLLFLSRFLFKQRLHVTEKWLEGTNFLRIQYFTDKIFAPALARKGTSLPVSFIQEW